MNIIVQESAKALGFELSDLVGKSRRAEITDARRMIGVQLRDRGYSWLDTAKALGRTNHTTAIYWIESHSELMAVNWQGYRQRYEEYCRRICSPWRIQYDFDFQDDVVFAPV